MAIEGPLKELGIHDVFQLLDLSRKTGALSVRSGLRHNRGTVYFEGGTVVSAEIQSNPHPLGELLCQGGKITEADLNRARDMQERGDRRRLGEVLVAIGAITARELERVVRFQIEEVVFEVMGWHEGYFSFEEGPLGEVPAEATVRIPTEVLLMEGARRIDEWSRIERRIPHLGVIPVLAATEQRAAGQLDLRPSEWEVLAAIDGARDLKTIANSLGRSDFDVAKTLFGLESAGVVAIRTDRVGEHAGPGAEGLDGLERLERRVEHALREGSLHEARSAVQAARGALPREPAVCFLAARVEVAAGRWADAEDQLRRALRLDAAFAAAHRLLGVVTARQGRHGEAIEWWERWLTLTDQDGTDPVAREQVGKAIEAVHGLQRALESVDG